MERWARPHFRHPANGSRAEACEGADEDPIPDVRTGSSARCVDTLRSHDNRTTPGTLLRQQRSGLEQAGPEQRDIWPGTSPRRWCGRAGTGCCRSVRRRPSHMGTSTTSARSCCSSTPSAAGPASSRRCANCRMHYYEEAARSSLPGFRVITRHVTIDHDSVLQVPGHRSARSRQAQPAFRCHRRSGAPQAAAARDRCAAG